MRYTCSPASAAVCSAVIALSAMPAAATQVQDLVRIKGHERNVLTGLGIVVGLNGTGDKGKDSLVAARPFGRLLENLGNPTASLDELAKADSYALVMVTMNIPPTGVREGDRLDVSVESMFNASDLAGGRLIVSMLRPPMPDSSDLVPLAYGEGPVVIDEGACVRQHACVCGPAYIGRGTVVHPHAFIHGGTSIGPVCKVGGEIDGCVFQGYSNKPHLGFLGHAYVANWVNIGADTNNSNLKNTYSTVSVPINGQEIDTGLTFFGCVIGDHVKMGIQQAISTGSVLGFAANVAGSRILPPFVRSFTWLTDRGPEEGDAERLARTAARAMERRQVSMTEAEQALFERLTGIVEYFEPSTLSQRAAYETSVGSGHREPMPSYGDPAPR